MLPQTSFRQLHKAGACPERYRYLAKRLGGIKGYGRDTPITIVQILDICGLDDALWALRACPEHDDFKCILCLDYAEHVLPLAEMLFHDNGKIRECLHAIRDYVNIGVPSLDHTKPSYTLKLISEYQKAFLTSKERFQYACSRITQAVIAGALKALYAAELAIEKAIAVYKVRPIYGDDTILVAEADRLVAKAAEDAAKRIGQGRAERLWQISHLSDLLVQYYGQEAQEYGWQ